MNDIHFLLEHLLVLVFVMRPFFPPKEQIFTFSVIQKRKEADKMFSLFRNSLIEVIAGYSTFVTPIILATINDKNTAPNENSAPILAAS